MNSVTEFKKNPELKEEELNYIKDWYSKQAHLPQNIPDETIILIMHSCYYSMELTKQTLDHYFTLRTHIPEFFNNRNFANEDLQEAIKTVYVIPFEGRTKEGYKVIMTGLKRTDPQYYNFPESFRWFCMVIDAWIQTDGTVPGLIILVNFNGMKLGHLPKLTLPTMKKILIYLQEGLPVRLKGLHYINVVPFIDKVVALMRPFMKKELMDMLALHSEGSNTIYDIVPKEVFPNELGGSAGSMDNLQSKSIAKVKGFQEWFTKDEQWRVDEPKRPGKAKSAGELFGVDGTFRKLAID